MIGNKPRMKINDVIADAKASLADPSRPVTPSGGFNPHRSNGHDALGFRRPFVRASSGGASSFLYEEKSAENSVTKFYTRRNIIPKNLPPVQIEKIDSNAKTSEPLESKVDTARSSPIVVENDQIKETNQLVDDIYKSAETLRMISQKYSNSSNNFTEVMFMLASLVGVSVDDVGGVVEGVPLIERIAAKRPFDVDLVSCFMVLHKEILQCCAFYNELYVNTLKNDYIAADKGSRVRKELQTLHLLMLLTARIAIKICQLLCFSELRVSIEYEVVEALWSSVLGEDWLLDMMSDMSSTVQYINNWMEAHYTGSLVDVMKFYSCDCLKTIAIGCSKRINLYLQSKSSIVYYKYIQNELKVFLGVASLLKDIANVSNYSVKSTLLVTGVVEMVGVMLLAMYQNGLVVFECGCGKAWKSVSSISWSDIVSVVGKGVEDIRDAPINQETVIYAVFDSCGNIAQALIGILRNFFVGSGEGGVGEDMARAEKKFRDKLQSQMDSAYGENRSISSSTKVSELYDGVSDTSHVSIIRLLALLLLPYCISPNVSLYAVRVLAKLSLKDKFRAELSSSSLCLHSLTIPMFLESKAWSCSCCTSVNPSSSWPLWYTYPLLSRTAFIISNLTNSNDNNRGVIAAIPDMFAQLCILLEYSGSCLIYLIESNCRQASSLETLCSKFLPNSNNTLTLVSDVVIKLIRMMANIIINPTCGKQLECLSLNWMFHRKSTCAGVYILQLLANLLCVILDNNLQADFDELLLNIIAATTNLTYYLGKDSEYDSFCTRISIRLLADCVFAHSTEGNLLNNEEMVYESLRTLGNLTRRERVIDALMEQKNFKFYLQALFMLLAHRNGAIITSVLGILVNMTCNIQFKSSVLFAEAAERSDDEFTLLRECVESLLMIFEDSEDLQHMLLVCQVLCNILEGESVHLLIVSVGPSIIEDLVELLHYLRSDYVPEILSDSGNPRKAMARQLYELIPVVLGRISS